MQQSLGFFAKAKLLVKKFVTPTYDDIGRAPISQYIENIMWSKTVVLNFMTVKYSLHKSSTTTLPDQ